MRMYRGVIFSSLAAAVVVIQFITAIIGTLNGTKKYFIWEQLRIVAVWKTISHYAIKSLLKQ
jgi:hypothetical protein